MHHCTCLINLRFNSVLTYFYFMIVRELWWFIHHKIMIWENMFFLEQEIFTYLERSWINWFFFILKHMDSIIHRFLIVFNYSVLKSNNVIWWKIWHWQGNMKFYYLKLPWHVLWSHLISWGQFSWIGRILLIRGNVITLMRRV